MHIENMEKSIETLSTMLNSEVSKGAEACLEEMSEVADIIKDLSEAKYHCTITKEMKEAKDEEETLMKNGIMPDSSRYYRDYRYYYDPVIHGGRYYGGMNMSSTGGMSRNGSMSTSRYYNDNRYSNGTYAPSSMSTNRNYSINYPDMYDPKNEFNNNKWRLDERNMAESRYERARRGYTETKANHSGNSNEDKSANIASLEEYMKELSTDVTEMIQKASPEEKSVMKSKLSSLVNRI